MATAAVRTDEKSSVPASLAILQRRVLALEAERNACQATIYRQFTARQARVKLQKLYPVVKTQLD